MDDEEEEEWPSGIRFRLSVWTAWLIFSLVACSRPAAAEFATRARCSHSEGRLGSSAHVSIDVVHELFSTDKLVPGIKYQVVINPGLKVTDFSLWFEGECVFGTLDPVKLTHNFTVPNKANVTFMVRYQLLEDQIAYELPAVYRVSQECEVTLLPLASGNLSSSEFPGPCLVHMTTWDSYSKSKRGLVIKLTKLNVPCQRGALLMRGHKKKICGKLEEIREKDRIIHFPDGLSEMLIEGKPIFQLEWSWVDHCYQVKIFSKNGTIDLTPNSALECNYKISFPYGYRVSLSLRVSNNEGEQSSIMSLGEQKLECSSVKLILKDGDSTWSQCYPSIRQTTGYREMELVSNRNSISIDLKAKPGLNYYPNILLRYEAVGDESIVGGCPWPWVGYETFCLLVIETPTPWEEAEEDCVSKSGHLASIRSQEQQDLIDLMLLNSPGYKDENLYWIGASDKRQEGVFQWSDLQPFSYSNWFPGSGDLKPQPSDDNFSGEDCVVLTRLYKQRRTSDLLDTYMWNDRDCHISHHYICERLISGEQTPLERWECNRTVFLTPDDPKTTVTSPGFPNSYPVDTICNVKIQAPPHFTILLEFEELVLEAEHECGYDYVRIQSGNYSENFCGDYSDRLKLLRKVLPGPDLSLKFVSDYSYNFGGFKARISIEQIFPECGDDRLKLYNNSCYLFVSYPEVTWNTAKEICKGMKGELASVHSTTEERFIVRKIRESREYSTSAIYWLGGKLENDSNWHWDDNTTVDFNGWVSQKPERISSEKCLGLRWTLSPSPILPSGLYWSAQQCDIIGGYVCKKNNLGSGQNLNLNRTITGTDGTLSSPQYPQFYLNNLDYWTILNSPTNTRIIIIVKSLNLEPQPQCFYDFLEIQDPLGASIKLCAGKRIWLQIVDYDTGDDILEVDLGGGGGKIQPFFKKDILSDGVYLSSGERMQITLKTGDNPSGRGYKAVFKTVGEAREEHVVILGNRTFGRLLDMNYPAVPPSNVELTQRFVAPVGNIIQLQINAPEESNAIERTETCNEENIIEVMDWNSDKNGTVWKLCGEDVGKQVSVETYLNSVSVRCIYGAKPLPRHNITITVKPDPDYKTKILAKSSIEPYAVESCTPNPCENGGKCVFNSRTGMNSCQCIGHFTGLMCILTMCDFNPCLYGDCVLTSSGFKCNCKPGYHGDICDMRIKRCSSNPCDSRGDCVETDTSFKCKCHAWWEGTRCERRMMSIPFRPLSERMLREPFWLGLITVTVVLGVLGLFWCAKRHFPEKLEKLLAEENDKGRPYSSRHCPSVRERTLAATVTAGGTGGSGLLTNKNGDPVPRTLLGRLGIRKPSLLLVPSNNNLLDPKSSNRFYQGRTFSLDDLVTGATTPSPRKKRNNSTPTKKTSASEKKQMLQQLITPSAASSINDGIPLSTKSNSLAVEPSTSGSCGSAETSFVGKLTPNQSLKLEKKVTFARLLDKVSSEMSSGSELEVTGCQIYEPDTTKSPNSTSSNQGSDSRSSSETHLSLADARGKRGCRKTASADSILAMFRNFSSVSGSGTISPTTGSSHGDEAAGSDDSSLNTPTSSSSGLAESPMFPKRNIIQVSVYDPLTAQKSNNIFLQPPSILLEVPNRGLSPIRELPTPSPSPALTPVMPRHTMSLLSPTPYKTPSLKLDLSNTKEVNSLIIPVVTVEEASPVKTAPYPMFHGSPPPQSRTHYRPPLLKDIDKPNSLDLPCPPPIITVTCSMTEGESDADSPVIKSGPQMCYLSPFSMCSRNDRTTSESNLSSSGYSSMASPGPSRCGSNNPLCPNEDDHHIPRKPSPLLRAPSEDNELRGRSDSETLSDEQQLESNDEGFGTDQLEEKIEDGEIQSAKELEIFLDDFSEKSRLSPLTTLDNFDYFKKRKIKHCTSVEEGLDKYRIAPPPVRHTCSADEPLDSKETQIVLQLPSILIDGEPHLPPHSPMSSRSDSPMSDKTGLGRYSPVFNGRFTDSDGLYDCASSDNYKSRKHSSRKRERRRSKSPTRINQILLEVPGKGGSDPLLKTGCFRSIKPSPKRRARPTNLQSTSSSSSAESLNSIRDVTLCLSREQPGGRLAQSGDRLLENEKNDRDEEEGEVKAQSSGQAPKISRMRAIGHQIRFLRRLEQSLKRNRERLSSPERPLLSSSYSEISRSRKLAWSKQRGTASDGQDSSKKVSVNSGQTD